MATLAEFGRFVNRHGVLYSSVMKNKQLTKLYNSIYRKGERKHYTSLRLSGDKTPPAKMEVLKQISWKGKRVLDAGCGTGEMPHLIAKAGAKEVIGIDYSKDAIRVAESTYIRDNLKFSNTDIKNVKGRFDVIISLGTLEHLDHPFEILKKFKKMLKPGGHIIITCPNWTNPRGYVLMTLWHLFRARITLADLNYFTPLEFEYWADKLGMRLTWKTVDQEWGHGEKCIRDFERRLPNVARDSNLPTTPARIKEFTKWLEMHMVPIEQDVPYGGAVGVYHFAPKKKR